MARPRKSQRDTGFSMTAYLRSLSGRTIAKFALVAVCGFVGAWLTFALAVSGVARSKAPDQALAFIAGEGNALATRTDMLLMSGKKLSPKRIAASGRAALRNGPINAKAVRLVAIAEGLEGNEVVASKLVHRAAELTRRDPLTHMFLIEEAARRDDLKTVLAHHDVALRSSSVAPQILFPRLLNAIRYPDVRAELKPYIRSGEQWTTDFVGFGQNQGKDLAPLVDLLLETGGTPDAKDAREQRENMISALVTRSQYDEVVRYVRGIPGTAGLLTGVGLETLDPQRGFGAAGWRILDDAEAGASARAEKNQWSMTVYANPSTSRSVAQKLLFLTPGRYRFAFNVSPIDKGEEGAIGWQLTCLQPHGLLWRMDGLMASGRADWNIAGGCRVQLLELIVSGGRGQTGMEAVISSLSLDRSGAGARPATTRPAEAPAKVSR